MRSRVAGKLVGAVALVMAAGAARADVIQVRIEKLAFSPAQISAHAGDTIEWVNADFLAHTATARNGAWDIMIPPNATRSVVVKGDGPIDYYCKFHPNMSGQISIAK
jgi:plastocyanin